MCYHHHTQTHTHTARMCAVYIPTKLLSKPAKCVGFVNCNSFHHLHSFTHVSTEKAGGMVQKSGQIKFIKLQFRKTEMTEKKIEYTTHQKAV